MAHPKTLIEFMELYPTEDACRQVIFEHRWPDGFVCPRCAQQRARYLRGRCLHECACCHRQGSLTAGTILARTRTDLRKWFLAIWPLASTKKAPSAAELSRQLGVTAKTAWLMRREVTHAMARRRGELLLRGIVELDERSLGGQGVRPASRGRRHGATRRWSPSRRSTPGGGLGRAHLLVVRDGSASSLDVAACARIAAGAAVQTDGWRGYAGLTYEGYDHRERSLAQRC